MSILLNTRHVIDTTRREFLQRAGTAGLALAVGAPLSAAPATHPDYTLRIAPVSVEIAAGKIIQTVGYNGTAPGPLIRLREGKRVSIRVINDSDVPELVHWHGLKIPSAVDGAMEEGTPMIMPGHSASYTFEPKPTGTRWYHTHAMAKNDLTRSLYGGQYGLLCSVRPHRRHHHLTAPSNLSRRRFQADAVGSITGPSMGSPGRIPIPCRSNAASAIGSSSTTTAATCTRCTCIGTVSRWSTSPAPRPWVS
jgi:hypothetical protein